MQQNQLDNDRDLYQSQQSSQYRSPKRVGDRYDHPMVVFGRTSMTNANLVPADRDSQKEYQV